MAHRSCAAETRGSMRPTQYKKGVFLHQNPKKQEPLYCGFCGKSHDDVSRLIAGPITYICDECVALCVELLGQQMVPKEQEPQKID